jgi:uncharacterized protein (DUF1015 family)
MIMSFSQEYLTIIGVKPAQTLQKIDIERLWEMVQMAKIAVGYCRTSSATNVGSDKYSLKRQQEAVQAYAKANGIEDRA